MPNIIRPKQWQIKESLVTSRSDYQNRRAFLRKIGLGTLGAVSVPTVLACRPDISSDDSEVPTQNGPLSTIPQNAPRDGLPATRNARFKVAERDLTARQTASGYNNFYEFDASTKEIWPLTESYEPFPMTIEVDGLVEKKKRWDVETLIKEFGLEERIYRFRCVEAWAMTVPWSGFPLRKLIEKAKPLSAATHVAFLSVNRPKQMPGIRNQPWYPWPYYEGLRMDEATNELSFVATGLYGEPLPKQNGSPLRLVIPWKYGYKGPKAIVRMTFVNEQPKTFWNDLQPSEYSFLSNVNPAVPHPRWSQATERLIGENRRVPTLRLNGYEEWVGSLYPDEP